MHLMLKKISPTVDGYGSSAMKFLFNVWLKGGRV